MSGPIASRRPRVARRAQESARRAPVGGWSRARVAAVLADAAPGVRRIAVLLLVEGLSANEAALALDVPMREVTDTFESLMADLRHALRAVRLRPPGRGAARPRLVEIPNSLRRAS